MTIGMMSCLSLNLWTVGLVVSRVLSTLRPSLLCGCTLPMASFGAADLQDLCELAKRASHVEPGGESEGERSAPEQPHVRTRARQARARRRREAAE